MDQGQALRLIQQRLEAASVMRSTARAAAKALRMMEVSPNKDPEMLIELAGLLEKDVAAFEAAQEGPLMKLFVWYGDGVLEDYTSGQITALAPDLEGALLAIEKECNYCMQSFPTHRPTDVVDLGECPGVEPSAWVTYGGG